MDIREVDPGESFEPIWDSAIAERLAAQLEVTVADLSVALATPAAADAGDLPPGWRLLAVTYPGNRPISAVGGYLAERALRPGSAVTLDRWWNAGERNLLVDGQAYWGIGWTDEAIFLFDFDIEPYLETPAEELAGLPDVAAAVTLAAEALLPRLPAPTPVPFPSWAPRDDAEPTPEPDPSMEAVLPATAGDLELARQSLAYLREQDTSGFGAVLFSALLPHFDRPATDAALGIAFAEGTSFSVWAHHIRDLTGEDLLGALLGELFVGKGGGMGQTFEAHEVSGRRYVANQSWALYAQGDILYWLLYFDVGDCFEDCETDDRPALEDIVRDAIEAIPQP